MDPLFEQGVALITGAGSGIGQQISRYFALRGCKKVFLVDLSTKGLEETRNIINSESPATHVTLQQTDVSNNESVKEMVRKCVEVYGRIDFAANNAGIATPNIKTADMEVKMFDRTCNVNMKGIHLCHKYEIEQMLQQEPLPVYNDYRAVRGSIVDTASMCGRAVLGTLPAYNSSKHAVISLMRVDARQYAKDGIRINAVCPGFVDTPMMRSDFLSEEHIKGAKAQSPMNRFVDSTEVAKGVMFLSGSAATAVTGTDLMVDAGAMTFHVF
ncbi:NAD(P)-binding protein [Lepidopterella palustris CBS 459.81]|uniref:NAD(P)-binding protein n=1 Tax=Lepidopterella palustris CBS 459.81 TaxID=1314670 RepID=A0A8E2EBK0_9PEZI|nr:NAD(P)-binding protein [Lepidopterella palustris CBS 459.81]